MHHLSVWFRLYQNTVKKLRMKIVQVSIYVECVCSSLPYILIFFLELYFIDFGDFLFKFYNIFFCGLLIQLSFAIHIRAVTFNIDAEIVYRE